ncbi:hypothetical protein AMS62_05515 [Bacillus sp. FJAT-18019]|nr:hypothetical protein AMS62_05515 [Bacillus sp. FJAT-18019]
MEKPNIILSIPGIWKDREHFKEEMLRKGNGYIYMGNHIGNLNQPSQFTEVQIIESNPYIAEVIKYNGRGVMQEEDIEKIKKHQSVIHLIGEGGSIENVFEIMDVASAVLEAGGIAVNVESSGRARSKQDWLEINRSRDIQKLFSAFIQMSRGEFTFYTSGMHCFGYRDLTTSVENILAKEVANLFRIFCLFNLDEKPNIRDGETFSISKDSPTYLLKESVCTMFEEEDPCFNPYGVWDFIRYHMPNK